LQWALLLWGVVVALVGFIPLALAYPIYKKTLNKRKRQYSEEILALSNDLLQNEAR